MHPAGATRRTDRGGSPFGPSRILREAFMHNGSRCGNFDCGGEKGERSVGHRTRATFRVRGHRNAEAVCLGRIRQSAFAGRQFQPGQVPEIASRQLAIVNAVNYTSSAALSRMKYSSTRDFNLSGNATGHNRAEDTRGPLDGSVQVVGPLKSQAPSWRPYLSWRASR